MAASKKRPPKRSRKKKTDRQVRVLLATLFLLAFVIVSLILLSQLHQAYRPAVVESPPPAVHRTTPQPVVWPPALNNLRAAVEGFLSDRGLAVEHSDATGESGIPRDEIQGEFPSPTTQLELARRLTAINADLRLASQLDTAVIGVYWHDQLLLQLHFHRPPTAVLSQRPSRLAIIIDDMGGNLESARRLLAIGIPLTFSVLPNTPEAPQVAELAHHHGIEVMIHIPMEPQGYPAINPGKGALLVGMPAKKIRTLFAGYRLRVPYAIGGNNHEGSLFTEQVSGMDTVLEEMKKDGLFFIDSLTTAQSVAYREARRLGVPTAVRDRFLDNELNVDKISHQIEKLVQLAKRQGHAIAICHPHPQTIKALEREASYLKNAGVELVPVSQLVD
jgi:polysaccharide deacetylase 2 family uncharacterized protein YibQ